MFPKIVFFGVIVVAAVIAFNVHHHFTNAHTTTSSRGNGDSLEEALAESDSDSEEDNVEVEKSKDGCDDIKMKNIKSTLKESGDTVYDQDNELFEREMMPRVKVIPNNAAATSDNLRMRRNGEEDVESDDVSVDSDYSIISISQVKKE